MFLQSSPPTTFNEWAQPLRIPLLEQEKEILYEDEWREFAADWKKKNYDFALY
jgi:hypothetical protein